MSYQVLARKWRPKNFEQLIGQDHVVTVLVNALAQQRLHHAYLFTGTRGVGKTTIARVFAKSLNCETGITATPCGVCDVCLDIDQGRFVDLLEIDAASRTKVDDTREILDNVQYAPTRGRYKVYLIDEVHMLSRSSFNALLKTLEEPPAHVKFILATTDPQKLPITVLSRCLQFHLKALTVTQIESKLKEILAAEEVGYDSGTLTLLAKAARGSMRDSLSLTDQAIAQGKGNILFTNLQQMLGGIDQNWIYKILIALIKQDSKGLMSLSLDIASYAPNYNRLFAELIQLLHQIAMYQVVNNHLDLSIEHASLLKKFSQALSPEDVQLYYQICLNGRKDLPYASDEQAAFDMTLLRLLAFQPLQAENILASNERVSENLPTAISFDENNLGSSQVTSAVRMTTESVILSNQSSAESNEVTAKNQQSQSSVQTEKIISDNDDLSAFETSQLANNAETIPIADLAGIEREPSIASNMKNDSQAGDDIQKPAIDLSPVDSILATRNMLRSRKKQLEPASKKSDGAAKRQLTENKQALLDEKIKKQASVPAIETLPKKPYTPEVIDPAKVKLANQVDKWANMIDAMALSGRLRQLAIHATIDENSTDDYLLLKLDQATKHLKTDNAEQQLEIFISDYLKRNVTVEITNVEKTVADPFKIQSHINDKRYDYAKAILLEDEIVIKLKQDFHATVDESTILAR
ncbi:MAG: DNA polymerase-3 subunit gamma/tau [Alteromonadaceae bacterium]|jgi:DNA polymerase-3 subunit gamma/tau|tara:strand:- start:3305 stop:5389 length:2085 start_codon:yes stop_codon:yes gene_type:complete